MKNLMSDLEVNEGNNFPDNSLHVALSFERMLRNVTQTTISPSRQVKMDYFVIANLKIYFFKGILLNVRCEMLTNFLPSLRNWQKRC